MGIKQSFYTFPQDTLIRVDHGRNFETTSLGSTCPGCEWCGRDLHLPCCIAGNDLCRICRVSNARR